MFYSIDSSLAPFPQQILIYVVAVMSMYTVQVQGVSSTCRNEYEVLSRVNPCISNGGMMKHPNWCCCRGIRKMKLGCFCKIMIAPGSLDLIDRYVHRCHMHVPHPFTCEFGRIFLVLIICQCTFHLIMYSHILEISAYVNDVLFLSY